MVVLEAVNSPGARVCVVTSGCVGMVDEDVAGSQHPGEATTGGSLLPTHGGTFARSQRKLQVGRGNDVEA